MLLIFVAYSCISNFVSSFSMRNLSFRIFLNEGLLVINSILVCLKCLYSTLNLKTCHSVQNSIWQLPYFLIWRNNTILWSIMKFKTILNYPQYTSTLRCIPITEMWKFVLLRINDIWSIFLVTLQISFCCFLASLLLLRSHSPVQMLLLCPSYCLLHRYLFLMFCSFIMSI